MKVNQLKTGVILSYLSQGLQFLIAVIYTPIMLRLLGQSEYGLYQLAYSIVSYLGLLSFGFGSAYIRFYSRYNAAEDYSCIAKLNGMFMTIFLIISGIAVLAGYVLVCNVEGIFKNRLSAEEISTAKVLMMLMIVNIAITFPSSVFDCIITAHEQFLFQRVISILQAVLNPFLTLPLLLLGYKSISLTIIATFLTILKLILNMNFCLKKLHIKFDYKKFDLKLLKEIWIFSFYIFINLIVDQINWNVDKFIIGAYRGTIGVAVYSIGAQINTWYISLSTAVSSVFIPKIHRIVANKNDNIEINDIFIKVGRLQFIILSLVLSGFIVFGQVFISFWAGEEYGISYYIAILLMISGTAPLIQNLGIEIQRAKNMHKFRSVLYLFIALSNILISIPFVKYFGEVGAAVGTALALIIGNGIIMNIYYQKKVGLNSKKFWKEIAKFIPAFIPCTLISIFILLFVDMTDVLQICLSAVCFVLCFCSSMYFLGFNEYEKNLVKKLLEKLKKILFRKMEY